MRHLQQNERMRGEVRYATVEAPSSGVSNQIAVFKLTGATGMHGCAVLVKDYADVADVLAQLYGDNREFVEDWIGDTVKIEVVWVDADKFEALEDFEP